MGMNPRVDGCQLCDELPTRRTLDLETVLVAGASGYIGGRLVPELVARGYRVRVMVRSKVEALSDRWPNCEVVVADALNPSSLMIAMEGVHTVFYLIHSMLVGPKSFADADRSAARWVRESAEQQQVKRIIYLGGLGDKQDRLSPHLSSRMAVADELALGSVPVTFLRAAIILGSGSASYEMMNHLIRRLWVLPVPSWAKTQCQPIGLRDVIKILVGVLEIPVSAGKIFDIGGPDVMTYREMMQSTAKTMKRKRFMFSVPIIPISFSKRWVSTFSGVSIDLVGPLIDSLKHDLVVKKNRLQQLIIDKSEQFEKSLENSMDKKGFPINNPRQNYRIFDKQTIRKAKRVYFFYKLTQSQSYPV